MPDSVVIANQIVLGFQESFMKQLQVDQTEISLCQSDKVSE